MNELNLGLPAPHEESPKAGQSAPPSNGGPHDQTHQQQSQRRPAPHVADERECLAALTQLPGLVAVGLLKTGPANAIRGVYATLLQHHRSSASQTGGGPAVDDGMLDLLRRHPEMAKLLAPILSDEQLALFMKRAAEEEHGEA